VNSSSCNGTLTVELPSKSNDDENTKEEEGISIVLTANMTFQLQILMSFNINL